MFDFMGLATVNSITMGKQWLQFVVKTSTVEPPLTATSCHQSLFLSQRTVHSFILVKPLCNGHLATAAINFTIKACPQLQK